MNNVILGWLRKRHTAYSIVIALPIQLASSVMNLAGKITYYSEEGKLAFIVY